MNCTKTVLLSLVVAILLGTAGAVFAAEDHAYEIAARSDRTDLGFGDSEVELQMVLRNAAGQESTRALRSRTADGAAKRSRPGIHARLAYCDARKA
jgi:hypothetical protein